MIRSLSATVKVGALLILVVAGILLAGLAEATGPGNIITTVDPEGGRYSSLVLDGSGNPVIAYNGPGQLRVLHCGDPNCSSGNSIEVVDAPGGGWASLVLDANGYPVISHNNTFSLRIVHCNDPNCSGGDEIATTVDALFAGIQYTSIALDANGNPVVSYRHGGDLRVLHCGDPNCSSGNSIESPDTAGDVGWHTSLALDSSDNPVVSYFDITNNLLKLLHCGDADCSSGNSIETPGIPAAQGQYSSLALDSIGNPVISYPGLGLKVLHCGDPNCSSGNSIESPDPGNVQYTSLILDPAGNPVVSYRDNANQDLKVLRCGDPNCSSGNSIESPDTVGDVGQHNSVALDGGGNPVVSYTNRLSIFELKVLHCVDKSCTGEKATPTATVTPTTTPTITPTPPPAVGGIALDGEVRLLPLEYPESSNSFGLLAWAIAVFAFTLTIGGATWLTRKRLIG